jgi:hypothetical protein
MLCISFLGCSRAAQMHLAGRVFVTHVLDDGKINGKIG